MSFKMSTRTAGFFACAVLVIGSVVRCSEVTRGDGVADGKKSLGGTGEAIEFTLANDSSNLTGVRIHGSRYGLPDAPNENFLIYILNEDMTEIVSTQMAPYALFERGPEKWVEVTFRKPVAVSKTFWVVLDFRAGRSKGVYVSYDSSSDGKRSRVGLPGVEMKKPDFVGDWMIEASVSE